jgi:hypothetical protein
MAGAITIFLVATVAVMIAFVFVAPAAASRAAARRQRSAGADELAHDAQQAIRLQGWRQDPTADAIVERTAWTDRELHDALEAMWASLLEADRRTGRAGRSSNHFALHDSGIAAILKTLRDRLGIPQPWERRAPDAEIESETEIKIGTETERKIGTETKAGTGT